MTVGVLFSYIVPLLAVAVVAAISGGLTAWWLLHHCQSVAELVTAEPESDEFVDSEIDLASARWQEANNLPPEAAGLMSARLKTLHEIGKGKGWF